VRIVEQFLSGGQKLRLGVELFGGFGLLFGIERLAGAEPDMETGTAAIVVRSSPAGDAG